jgi:hypothetical protein
MKIKDYYKQVGIPLAEVGPKFKELNKAIEAHDMAIGADMTYQLDMIGTENECVKAVTLTVYLFQRKDDQDPEINGRTKAVKNPEETNGKETERN